ncbi:MAG: GYF domain-containing protein [Muribaculaceae bacterium]|nr:GYF domain-containing protein [Muribaculaceae bacterium]
MTRQWYIIGEGRQQVGPIPEDALAAYGIKPTTLVWTAGMPEWRRASECPSLAPLLAPASAPRSERIDLRKPVEGEDFRQVIDVTIDDERQEPAASAGGRIPDPDNPGHWKQVHGGGAPQYGHPGAYYGEPQPERPYGTPSPEWRGYDAGSGKSNIVAGLLAIFLGVLGIQYFYIGKVGGGLLTILLSIVSCGLWSIITLIQGIYMITLPQAEFDKKYVYSGATFPLF